MKPEKKELTKGKMIQQAGYKKLAALLDESGKNRLIDIIKSGAVCEFLRETGRRLKLLIISALSPNFSSFASQPLFTPPLTESRAVRIPHTVRSEHLNALAICSNVRRSIICFTCNALNVFTVLHPVWRLIASISTGVNSLSVLPCDHSIVRPLFTSLPGASVSAGFFQGFAAGFFFTRVPDSNIFIITP